MGDKSPKSKQKNKSQKQSKANAAARIKQSNIDRKQRQGLKAPPKKG